MKRQRLERRAPHKLVNRATNDDMPWWVAVARCMAKSDPSNAIAGSGRPTEPYTTETPDPWPEELG